MYKKLALAAAVFTGTALMAGSASAGVIVDPVPQLVKVDLLSPHFYQHNLLDNGFVLGSALSATLSINIYDDANDFLNAGEGAVIVVENFDFDTGGVWGAVWGSATPGWANGLGINAMASLNADGIVDVLITGLGDFWVGQSMLTVETAEAAVPAQ